MRRAEVRVDGVRAGILEEREARYTFIYDDSYRGSPVSLTMPIREHAYEFNHFPPFFDGLLPEGVQLEALLRQAKLDRTDYMGQLLTVGRDLVGNVTLHPVDDAGTSSRNRDM